MATVLFVGPRQTIAGLYRDEAQNVPSGDIKDQHYWAAKFDLMMLDIALEEHQPESHIGLNLASTSRSLDALEKNIQARRTEAMANQGE